MGSIPVWGTKILHVVPHSPPPKKDLVGPLDLSTVCFGVGGTGLMAGKFCRWDVCLGVERKLLENIHSPTSPGTLVYWPEIFAINIWFGWITIDWVHLKLCKTDSCVGCAFIAQLCLTLCGPWTVARQAPLFIQFSSQEYCSELPCPSPGNLPQALKKVKIQGVRIWNYLSSSWISFVLPYYSSTNWIMESYFI